MILDMTYEEEKRLLRFLRLQYFESSKYLVCVQLLATWGVPNDSMHNVI